MALAEGEGYIILLLAFTPPFSGSNSYCKWVNELCAQ
jgi:hypothetical protein